MSIDIVFPILKLPLLCIEFVLHNCNVPDLIHLSLCSKIVHRLICLIKSPVTKISVGHNSNAKIIFYPSRQCWWLSSSHESEEDGSINVELDGVRTKNCLTERGLRSISPLSDGEFLKFAVPYVLQLFKCPIKNCMIFVGDGRKLSDIDSLGFNKCEFLQIETAAEFNHSELRNIIQKIEVSDWLSLFTKDSDGFQCDPTFFKSKILTIRRNSSWLTRDTLFKLECSTIKLYDKVGIHFNDIVEFVGRWFNSEDKKFDLLAVYVPRRNVNMEMFRQFRPIKYNKKRRGPKFLLSESWAIDSTQGWDLLRKDGYFATVILRHNRFYFHVWHEPFPVIPDDATLV